MLFSISIGEEDRRSLIDVMKIVMTKGMLVVAGIVALLIILADPLTRFFYHDPSDPVYGMTMMGFRILPLCMLLSVWSLTYSCYAQAAEKKKMSIVLPVVDGFAGVVLFSLLLIPAGGINGLYVSNVLNGFLCALVIAAGAWIVLKRFPRTLEDQMAIPKAFGAEDNERIDITVRSMDEVMQVSMRVVEFCEKRGVDRRRSFLSGLCMEEMAGNIVSHGFTKDQKKHSVDIRVIHKGDDVILRIRDNCRAFNPSEHARLMDPGEMGKNVGIRLVYGMARSVSYQNLLGMNVLTMRI
jgi:anti-sigma regulatory factor (Ser/Thr protein kinase)